MANQAPRMISALFWWAVFFTGLAAVATVATVLSPAWIGGVTLLGGFQWLLAAVFLLASGFCGWIARLEWQSTHGRSSA